MTSDQVEAYLDVLATRSRGAKRDTIIAGTLLVLAVVTVIVFGALHARTPASLGLFFLGAMIVAFLISFVKAWMELQITRSSIDLLKTLRRSAEANTRSLR